MERPFLEIGVQEPLSLCNGWQSRGYWLWMEMALEMPTHITCLSTGSISEDEDLLIYSPVSFPAFSFTRAPIIITDIIISSFTFNLLSSSSLFFLSYLLSSKLYFLAADFCFTLPLVVILSPSLSVFYFIFIFF